MAEPSGEFKELVKDALHHLYDVGRLQAHPLADLLTAEEGQPAAGGKSRSLRQALFESIEALDASGTGSLDVRTGRTYKLLHLRYIEGVKAQEVALRMAFSDRQYYRELEKAIDEVSQLLWDRVSDSHPANPFNAEDKTTVESEALRLSQQEKDRWFNLWEVIQGLADDLHPVLNERRTTLLYLTDDLSKEKASARIPIYTNRTLLRQLLLYLMISITTRFSGGELEIGCSEQPEAVLISLRYTYPADRPPAEIETCLNNSEELTGLLNVLNASIRANPEQPGELQICLPTSQANILIVDDNANTVHMFRRFLSSENCRIFDASSVSHAVQFLRQTSVSINLIIMDVMMPNQDGWEGLQKLHAHPSSQHIPVVICSVLMQPELATALGAAGFLAKPVAQEELLQIVRRFIPA